MLRRVFLTLATFGLMFLGQKGLAQDTPASKWILVGTLPIAPVGRDSVLGLIEIKGQGDELKAEWLKHGID